MLRSVSQDGTRRYVDPVFQHSWRHYMGFVRDLVNVGSVGFVEDAVEHRWSLFRCQEGWRSEVQLTCLRLASGPFLTGEGLCRVEF